MGCNCHGTKVAQNYQYTSPDGKRTTYRTEVEAQAAVIKGQKASGIKGSYKPVPR